jgi:metallophosphoesterase (TIGR00282 family)
VRALLPVIVAEHGVDLVVANGENATRGTGISARHAKELLEDGVAAITLGNHALRQSDIAPMLNTDERIVRPGNFPRRAPGKGLAFVPFEHAGERRELAVINVSGTLYIDGAAGSPFDTADDLVEQAAARTNLILVDMHAEATSEKRAMGFYLDGRVSAVVGTHTHVQTSDACLLPEGTGYITDLGMTGPHDSIIGTRTDIVLKKFTTGIGARFEPAFGDARLEGAVIRIDSATGLATSIEAIRVPLAELAT